MSHFFNSSIYYTSILYRKSIILILLAFLVVTVNISKAFAKECTGKFVNPITDVCWECIFPITLGGIEIQGTKGANDTKNPSSPVCVCSNPVRAGIIGGFWEPVRMVDVSHEPYCFTNMGGMRMGVGITRGVGTRSKATSNQVSNWYVHYYVYPLLYWLEILTDFVCLERISFDIAYLSELDPMGLDDELSVIIHPEAFLFNNVAAQLACSADCLLANVKLGLDPLFWCSGCQGSMYPMNGNIHGHKGGVQASTNAAERLLYKMHRLGLADETAAKKMKDTCKKRKSFIMKKSTYRYQMVNPNPAGCQQFGKTTMTFEAGKEIPKVGEDFGYLIWRKVNCCIM